MLAAAEDVKTIFGKAIQIHSPDERARFLDQVCAGNAALRVELESLLAAIERAGNFLGGSPDLGPTLDQPIAEAPGTLIGPYKLLQEIGQGGMGTVFMAEQREPVKRRVALKIVKPGMDSAAVVRRFEAERQALAMMDHPNIAHVYDAGATETGRPFFVMELVKGLPITQYCDEHQLTPKQRLELFIPVCQAVQHAHQKGIIHRDLKPSNILVAEYDEKVVPKIIDFGVAKSISQSLTEKTMFTQYGQIVGTPEYMSPEQAKLNQLDIDTRSDIYALGVVLYELLTGDTPFDRQRLRSAPFDEMLRIIREEEPPRPSLRVSTLGAQVQSTIFESRRIDVCHLSQSLRGELDWIVMKALEKDRTRRYESASALAADLERYLSDQPVHACPPSLTYRASKFFRRYKARVYSAAVLALAAVALAAGAWNAHHRAVQIERGANDHLGTATALFESGDYAAAARELEKSRALLQVGSNRPSPSLEQTQRLADLLDVKRQSIERFEQFQKLRQRVHSKMHSVDRALLDEAQAHCRLALDLYGPSAGDGWKGQPAFQDLSAGQQATLAEGLVELLFVSARLEISLSDWPSTTEQQAHHRRALEAFAALQSFAKPIPAVHLWMADAWDALGEKESAKEAREKAGALQPAAAIDYFVLAEHHARHRRLDEALESYWQVLARQPGHYLSLLAAGITLAELKRHDGAEAMLTGAIAMHPDALVGYTKRGAVRLAQNKIALARADFHYAKTLDPQLANVLVRRATEYLQANRFDSALADFSDALRIDPQDAAIYNARAAAYRDRGELEKALADANETVRLVPDAAWPYLLRARVQVGRCDRPSAWADAEKAVRIDPQCAQAYLTRGQVRLWASIVPDRQKALADMNEAIRLDPNDSGGFACRAAVYLELREPQKALADCQQAIRLDPGNVNGHFWLGESFEKLGDHRSALAAYDKAVQVGPHNGRPYNARARFHRNRGNLDKALADCDEAIRMAPQDSQNYILRSGIHRASGDSNKALADANEAIRLRPNNGYLYASRGALQLDRGELDQALADFDRGAELGMSWSLYERRAQLYFDRQNYVKALESIAKAVELNPSDSSNLWWIPPAAVAKCPDERFRTGMLELADKTVEKSPNPAEAYAVRGLLRDALGRSDDAAADFNRALQIDPKQTALWRYRAEVHVNHARWNEALADLAQCIQLDPVRAYIWYQRGLIRLLAGQSAEYRRDCAAMLDRFGATNDDNAHWVAWTCALAPNAVSDWPKALALAENVAHRQRHSGKHATTYGAVLYRVDRFKEALQRLTEAETLTRKQGRWSRISPAYPCYFLAMTLQRLGRHDEARQWFEKANADSRTDGESLWNRRATLELLRAEAQALLGIGSPQTVPNQTSEAKK